MRERLFLTLAALLLLCVTGIAAESEQEDTKLLGDEGDGSRSQPVHLIPLYTEEGDPIAADDEPAMPFSTKESCGACHSYDKIETGWHFNAADPNADPGRPGQPWIYVDLLTATQVPLSYRDWPGVFKPSQVGLSKWGFTKEFARHLPGGGVGEAPSDDPMELGRQMVSGDLEINCLGCHNASPRQDQAEYAMQMRRENFRWSAAAASGVAHMSGSASKMDDMFDYMMPDIVTNPKLIPQVPKITYLPNVFEDKNRVFFHIVREVPAERCYYCHSNMNVSKYGNEKWEADQDIHMTAGMTCVDCHRNGLHHDIVRGYEGEHGNPLAAHSSCEGCHMGDHEGDGVEAGRFGAPRPEHIGIPAVHFEKLTCTACHSGPWPGDKTYRVKNSQAHALGTRTVNKSPDALPHIEYPVMATRADGKIAPHKLIWPAFWGVRDANGVSPLDVSIVTDTIGDLMRKQKFFASGDWPEMNDEVVVEALGLLAEAGLGDEDKVVYVCGGKIHSLGKDGKLVAKDDEAAEPYMWPVGHNVRPASQSLGVRYCTDCHSTDEGFFFGEVAVDGPLTASEDETIGMMAFQDADPTYTKLFAQSFVFRPILKIVALVSVAVIGAVVLLYVLRALRLVAGALVGKD